MYRIGIVTSDLERDWTSRELLRAANDLAEGVMVDPISFDIHVDGGSALWIHGQPANVYDAYIVRGFNRRGEIDYQYEIFELLTHQGRLVINSTAGLSLAESKAQTTYCLHDAGLPVPRTIVTQNMDEAAEAINSLGAAVIKPLYGSHGVGIERIDADTDARFLQAFMRRHGIVYIQEYIPNAGRDIRAFVVGDEIPAAMYRVAHEGQWKTNVYQGSSCEPCELTPAIREICIEATRTIGLDYTGVDVIEGPDGPMVLELNGAPSWYGLSETTDRNVAEDIVRHVLRKLEAGQTARQPTGLRIRERT